MASPTPLNQFLGGFALPLVAGGRVEVRGLIPPGALVRFSHDRQIDGTLVAEITAHARALLARLGPVAGLHLLPPDAIALLAVWHNLLAMTHPNVVGRMRLRRRVRKWSESMLAWAGPPRTAAEVALRHALLARLDEVGRVDTDVMFWAGSAHYVGVAPPARLLAWPSVRRVRETKVRVPFFDLLSHLAAPEPADDLLATACAALALSPLTDVALVERPAIARFAWTGAAVNALGDPPLRGAFVRIALGPTAPGDRVNDAGPPRVRLLEQASQEAAERALPPAAARTLVAFHLEALATDAIGRGAVPRGHALAWDALARLGTERVARIVGLLPEALERALGLDQQPREPAKDSPSAPLLARAGLLEVAT